MSRNIALGLSLAARVALLIFFGSLAIQPDSWVYGIGAAWFLLLALGFTRTGFFYWAAAVTDAVLVAAGAMALPEFGHLHGGELFAYLAIPAAVDLVASSFARWRRSKGAL